MSMFRKTALTSAVIGAGLVSTAGAAFAGDAPCESHHAHSSTQSSSDCGNAFGGSVDNGGAKQLGGINGSQGALQGNLCDIANGNSVLSGNHISVLSLDESEFPVEDEAAAPAQSAPTQSAPARSAPAPATAPAAPARTAPATTTTPVKQSPTVTNTPIR